MNQRFSMIWAGAASALLACLAGTVGCATNDTSADFLVERANVYRGGALWDTWWVVPDVGEAIAPGATVKVDGQEVTSSLPADNPLYATNPQANTRAGADTWRCKECHGWDYRGKDGVYGTGGHATGFAGVFASRDKSASDLFDAIKDGTGIGQGHAFGAVMTDADVADLVKFIKEGTVDTQLIVGSDKAATGDPELGKPLFEASCINCHGEDGKTINFKAGSYMAEYVYTVAWDNPWEISHKIRFGQPNGEMPNGSVHAYYLSDVADILAYVQTLAPKGLETASAERGGVLYDSWWGTKGIDAPADTNPLYTDATFNTLGGAKSGADTWRCKECHGWDYRGKDGAYATGSHATGIKGLWASSERSAAALQDAIGKGILPDGRTLTGHDFMRADMLDAADVADLALFVQQGLEDDYPVISYPTHLSKGSPAVGQGLFNGNCATCHGKTGMRVNFGHDEGPFETEYVGDVARDNPWELTHKVRFGQPESDADAAEMEEEMGLITGHMPTKADAGYTEAQVADVVAYAQTLPGSVERGGQAWDHWWQIEGVAEPIAPGGSITLEDGTVVQSSLPESNPSYPTDKNPEGRSGTQTWRCKECHGWDYKGKDGVYGEGSSHFTGITGVFGAASKDEATLRAAIADGKLSTGTDPNHAFGAVLGDFVVRDLVHFIQSAPDLGRELVISDGDAKGTVRASFSAYDEATNPTGMKQRTRDASIMLGQLKFENNCARCHGYDGRAINFGDDEDAIEHVADIAKENPWELLNKVLHGQPESEPMMPNATGTRYSYDDLADLLQFVQQLP